MAWLNGEFLILCSSYCLFLLNGMVHLIGSGDYLMNLILHSMFCEFGIEGLVYEMKLNLR